MSLFFDFIFPVPEMIAMCRRSNINLIRVSRRLLVALPEMCITTAATKFNFKEELGSISNASVTQEILVLQESERGWGGNERRKRKGVGGSISSFLVEWY